MMNFCLVLIQPLLYISKIEIRGMSIEKLIFGQTPPPPVTQDDASQNASTETQQTAISTLLGVDNNDIFLSTTELIEKNGYKAETHTVTTEDGYILTLHRIPYGKNHNSADSEKRPVVLLQQGVLSSSVVWVMNSVNKSLAYRLADQGYDVWIGNSRGTTYSKAHVSLDVKSSEYWDFSWHEMGWQDLKADFDYILGLTGQPDLHYVGHSMGTTLFFAGLTLRPEYNSKVRLFSALAPVVFTKHMVSPISLLAPYIDQLNWLTEYLGIYELLPNSPLSKFLGATVGHQLSPLQKIYPNIFYYLCGEDSGQMNKEALPIIVGHIPAGISVKSLSHFAHGINSGEFCQFDYGRRVNNAIYGQPTPPAYDLTKITCPIAIYYAENDPLSTKLDIKRLTEVLPNVVREYVVPLEKFNHMDFFWASDAPTLLYEQLEDTMRQFDLAK